jgi:hypothetical protein
MLDFLRWPLTILTIAVACYGGNLWQLHKHRHLGVDTAFASAQLFVSIGGAGAAIIAIARHR